MKTKKIISLFVASILIVAVIGGCSKKENTTVKKNDISIESIQPEEGHVFAIAENIIIPSFVTSRYSNYSSLVKDYVSGINTFMNDKNDTDFINKYGYQDIVKKDKCTCKDVQEVNPEFYEGFSTFLYFRSFDGFKHVTIGNSYLLQIQNYLQDTLLDEKNDGYTLSEDFLKLKPKKVVQDYLKENKIKITDIKYPDKRKCFDTTGAGTSMLTVDVPIEGTKDGKPFNETIRYDFHFVVSKDLREGAAIDWNNLDKGEIMAVTNSFYSDTIGGFDYEKLENKYKEILNK